MDLWLSPLIPSLVRTTDDQPRNHNAIDREMSECNETDLAKILETIAKIRSTEVGTFEFLIDIAIHRHITYFFDDIYSIAHVERFGWICLDACQVRLLVFDLELTSSIFARTLLVRIACGHTPKKKENSRIHSIVHRFCCSYINAGGGVVPSPMRNFLKS